MNAAWTIQLVPWRRRLEAARFIAAGAEGGPIVEARAHVLRQLLEQRGRRRARLWWAKAGRRAVAAAVVMESPGAAGMLFHSPPGAVGVDGEALTAVVRDAAADSLKRGMSFVQSLPEAQDSQSVGVLRAAGFERIARLSTMRLDLSRHAAAPEGHDLGWRNHTCFSERELGDVISRTYEGSLDCPRLTGLRRMSDVIASHKAGGVFRPEAWWIADRQGRPAGCVLVNDDAAGPGAELVYVGVVPEHRGSGIGDALLRRAITQAKQRGQRVITLAVDASNRFAVALYEARGFEQTHSREAYMTLPETQV